MQLSYSRSSRSGGQMATFCTYYEHRWPRGQRVKKKVPPKQVSVIILRERVCVRDRFLLQRRSLKSTRDLDSCVYIFYDLRWENLMPLNMWNIRVRKSFQQIYVFV